MAAELSPQWEYELSITIVSVPGSSLSLVNGNYGHAFIIVRNDSSIQLTIGHMTVPAESAITIGTFGNRSTHDGIWYNIEGYHGVSGGYAASYSVPYDDLSALNDAINYHDSHSDLTDNCTHFAKDVWNSVVPSAYQVTGTMPSTLASSISSLDIATTSYSVPQKAITDIAYQTSTSVVYSTAGANQH